jgi:hypothetical protein
MKHCNHVYHVFRKERETWLILSVCIHHNIVELYQVRLGIFRGSLPVCASYLNGDMGETVSFNELPARAKAEIRAESQHQCEIRYLRFVEDDVSELCERTHSGSSIDEA